MTRKLKLAVAVLAKLSPEEQDQMARYIRTQLHTMDQFVTSKDAVRNLVTRTAQLEEEIRARVTSGPTLEAALRKLDEDVRALVADVRTRLDVTATTGGKATVATAQPTPKR